MHMKFYHVFILIKFYIELTHKLLHQQKNLEKETTVDAGDSFLII